MKWPLGKQGERDAGSASDAKFSVVVAVYNPGTYIEPCIESLLGQSLPSAEYEVIFVDDGSSDQTPARLDEVAALHDNVTALHIPGSGWPGKPRNVGIDAAVGEYVYFVDHDDSLAPEALERLYDMAKRNDADVVIGKIAGHGRRVPRTLFREDHERCTVSTAPIMESMTPHKGFRRAFLNQHQIRFPEGRRRLEDHVFVVEAYLQARVVSVLSSYTCYHHIARPDGGNAGFTALEPGGYFGNLREGIDIAERLTEPGPVRDIVLRRWYQVEMLNRVGGKAFARFRDGYRWTMYAEVRSLALERFTRPTIWEPLDPQYRARSELLRAGRFDDLVALATFESGFGLSCSLEEMGWSGGTIELGLIVSVVDADGASVLVSSQGRQRLRTPIDALDQVDLTVTNAEPIMAQVLWRHRGTKQEHLVPAVVGPLGAGPGDDIRYHVRARIDPMTFGRATAASGVWDVFVRLQQWGAGSALTRRVGAVRGPQLEAVLSPALLGDPARVVVPYWTEQGNLSLDVDQKTKLLGEAVDVADATVSAQGSAEEAATITRIPVSVHLGEDTPRFGVRLRAIDPEGRAEVVIPAQIVRDGERAVVEGIFPRFTPPWPVLLDSAVRDRPTSKPDKAAPTNG